MKTHLNFATTDLAKSVEFYSVLLDAKPAKVLPDYALFITNDPGLELALDLTLSTPEANGDHFGLYVESAAEVDRAIGRLEDAGLATSIEREETCCYANQTKVWATDPTGRRWEIYTVHEDTEQRDTADAACCTGIETGCC
jgi:catechol 2,3-dioxygenase-like lactoylglutathione lyase family enzyme